MDVLNRASSSIDVWDPNWDDPFTPTAEADDEFAELVAAVRAVQEAFTRSRPDPATASAIAGKIRSVATELEEHEVGEDDQIPGRRWDLAGRGQALAPPLHLDEVTETTARGRVTVGRFHSGRYAMNGGVTPLIFDEIMARLANGFGRPWARTAYLHVDFRTPAPLHVELRVEAEFVRQDGRKRFMRGAMYHGDTLVAEADGLWVELKPEQTLNISERGTE
ncbi:hotdog fold thioesterase [Rhodococcus sp. HM1]|uniref:PaaI family thioesterase n=1 Tax=Rhodococcus sp. HM1 TaxID=2937759 RepID=UPI00200A3F00|nr:hotdog fold thioesterase [Rhodococcus sp. HM1]MCK8673031.1 hotdog fold thioesterase [Rhodococcus sp. HM1]